MLTPEAFIAERRPARVAAPDLRAKWLFALALGAFFLSPTVPGLCATPIFQSLVLLEDQASLELQGAPNTAYLIERSTDLKGWQRVLVSNEEHSHRTLLFAETNSAAFYRASIVEERPRFTNAILALGALNLNGRLLGTDSFDSRDPEFSMREGRYHPAIRKDNGTIASAGGIVDSLAVGGAYVWGGVLTGPGAPLAIGPNGAIGSADWHGAGQKGIEPGMARDDMDTVLYPVAVPFATGLPPFPGAIWSDGQWYDRVFQTGDYIITQGSFTGKTLVTGDARVHIPSGISINMIGTDGIMILADASLKLFVSGSAAHIGGYGVINESGDPRRFQYYGLPGHTDLSVSSAVSLIGLVYAPLTDLAISGGGGVTEVTGAIVVRNLRLIGNVFFHFDEALMDFNAPEETPTGGD